MTQKARVLHVNTDERVETGAVQFVLNGREDWPSLHIRGDCAAYLAFQLNSAIEMLEEKDKENKDLSNFMVISELKSIRDTIWGDVIVGGWSNNKNEGQVVS